MINTCAHASQLQPEECFLLHFALPTQTMWFLLVFITALDRASSKALNTKFVVYPKYSKCCTNLDGYSPTSSCSQEINSTIFKNGTFTSPNYPEPYPPNIYCVYKFIGKAKERLQISFTDFDLYLPPNPDEPPKDCEAVDAVMIFITIRGRRERLNNFCGNKLPAQLMSNGPTMELEFRSYHFTSQVKGFRSIYRFVTDFGISGTRAEGSSEECRFIFRSEDRGNGTFNSPNYPGFYPRDTECHYTFIGKDKERVHITFAYFDVDGIPPCLSETASDYVEFSNYKTVDRKLARHCGIQKPKLIESDADFFRVVFSSNDKFDATGFEAFYQFRKQVDPFTVKRVSTIPKDGKSVAVVVYSNMLLLTLSILLVSFQKGH
ncbi:suppressor of lurcher protein 1 isoform X1 [Parasteatoda tepidariorum]|uniref:suppressor of lurcher protein 1 isoform X1 n=1 Tax=Parasteatoda tepidariorum TaxID=114398 RepID=UPI001C719459|nr:suppressor of lurcher protein 1 isoform X2 [Parasteatoda tepidariorum]